MAAFSQRELFGGAVVVNLPQDYIDSSDIRQVPDHQEVYLSRTSLTSLIFEINEYVMPSVFNAGSSDKDNSETVDVAALNIHLRELIHHDDTYDEVIAPARVAFKSGSLASCAAYGVGVEVKSKEKAKQVWSALPIEWQSTPEMVEVTTFVYLLVARLKAPKTDILVHINVPTKELDPAGAEKEKAIAREMVENVLATLDVKDFGLFGE